MKLPCFALCCFLGVACFGASGGRDVRDWLLNGGVDKFLLEKQRDESHSLFLEGKDIQDLSVLSGMPLSGLSLNNTSVSNLFPLKNMPLKKLTIQNSPVQDLSPVCNSHLEYLSIDETAVQDLSCLYYTSLISLKMGVRIVTNGIWKVYDMASLVDMNGVPAWDYLRSVNLLRAPDPQFYMITERLSEKMLDQQVAENPTLFVENYRQLTKQFMSYDMERLSPESRRIGLVLVNNVGTAHVRLKRPMDALFFLLFSVSMYPDEIIVHRNLALALERCCAVEERESFYMRALSEHQVVLRMAGKDSPLGAKARKAIKLIAERLKTMRSQKGKQPVNPVG